MKDEEHYSTQGEGWHGLRSLKEEEMVLITLPAKTEMLGEKIRTAKALSGFRAALLCYQH